MSISSMLGSESDRPSRESNPAIASTTSASHHYKPQNTSSEMSPPQHVAKPSPGEYSYKPRSQTPDRMGISNLIGARQYRSGSGSIMQGSRPFEDPARIQFGAAFPSFMESAQAIPSQEPARITEESSKHVRRTSISGILQRPNSQPQPQVHDNDPGVRFQQVNQPQRSRPAWAEHSITQNPMGFNISSSPSSGLNQGLEYGKDRKTDHTSPPATASTQYDTRPPEFGPSVQQKQQKQQQQQSHPVKDRDLQPSVPNWERRDSNPASPNTRRQMAGPSQYRPFGSILNGQMPTTNPQPQETQHATSVPMGQQDSAQSHGERSIFGERLDKSRARLFSPFAGLHTSQSLPSASVPPEEQSRKGSDELSQHRALLGLAAEGKRGGRYSPLPQAVQGAQAQSIGPEMGIKSEHGRIFSGIGSGVGTASASPAHGPLGLAASPFKRDDNGSRLLNEDNLMKLSRSSSGFGKRARKFKEEEGKAASETEGNGRIVKKPRTHQ
jgi:hypothetical protein